ncbi:hypothetical protein BJ875DRAFT_469167 [Amylocarpus encephaloides]|uniref:Uncharacterized protein n=1 Tax=Amylocarpus encephaloides TaxID=45428 RepID=A0A9P8C419_9HELO|nr:hypothetical protein BJ875DRAFT_469167 [Amylocarpus encephaloides]
MSTTMINNTEVAQTLASKGEPEVEQALLTTRRTIQGPNAPLGMKNARINYKYDGPFNDNEGFDHALFSFQLDPTLPYSLDTLKSALCELVAVPNSRQLPRYWDWDVQSMKAFGDHERGVVITTAKGFSEFLTFSKKYTSDEKGIVGRVEAVMKPSNRFPLGPCVYVDGTEAIPNMLGCQLGCKISFIVYDEVKLKFSTLQKMLRRLAAQVTMKTEGRIGGYHHRAKNWVVNRIEGDAAGELEDVAGSIEASSGIGEGKAVGDKDSLVN